MQPVTTKFIQNEILLGQVEIFIEKAFYKAAEINNDLVIQERIGENINNYKVLWALGGKMYIIF